MKGSRGIRKGLFPALLALVALLLSVSLFALDQFQKTQEFQPAMVVRVVDGDTLIVKQRGVDYRLRLIGIDAPESVNPDNSKNTPEGELASEFLKKLLPPGTTVYLQKDVSETDRYDRLLRYVWLEVPKNPDSSREVEEKMVNAIIVRYGHAEAKRYPPDTRYSPYFEAIYDKYQRR